jgi:S1-C subfamily serine protease
MTGRLRRTRPSRAASTLAAVVACLGSACSPDVGRGDPLDAVLRLEIDSCTSLLRERATAVLIGDGLAATVAHPFLDAAGNPRAASLGVFDRDGAAVDAVVVRLDADTDVALLAISDAPAAALTLGDWDTDAVTSIVVFPESDAPPIERTVAVRGRVDATLDGVGRRTVLELEGSIEPGDSGAPVIDADHTIVGLVFAATDAGSPGGWAIDSTEYRSTEPGDEIPFTCD